MKFYWLEVTRTEKKNHVGKKKNENFLNNLIGH